jgi:hypothetical protein
MAQDEVLTEAKSGPALKAARKKCEEKIYKAFKILDKTGQNTEYYKAKFAKMSDAEFVKFFSTDFPLKFQTKVFEIDPKMTEIMDFLGFLNVPVLEKIQMPFLYTNGEGKGVYTQPVLVVYLTIKRLKQMSVKKSSFSTEISKRDFRTGLLVDVDKNGSSSDRELESMVVFGLDKSLKELITYRGEAMNAKNKFYAQINTVGMVRQSDVPVENEDSIARNLISAYLLGAHLNSNLVNTELYLPRTLKAKKSAGQKGLKRKE